MSAPEHVLTFRLGGRTVRAAIVEIEAVRRATPSAIDVRPDWLHHAEWEEAEVLTDRCRRWQWLAGRLAARTAIVAAEKSSPKDLRVLSRDPSGSPTPPMAFSGASAHPGWLSIAHDGALAVAVSASLPVGVDIVAPGRLPRDTARRWALDEARHKLLAALAVPGGRRRAVPAASAGTVDACARIVDVVMAVQSHLMAVCTLWEAA